MNTFLDSDLKYFKFFDLDLQLLTNMLKLLMLESIGWMIPH